MDAVCDSPKGSASDDTAAERVLQIPGARVSEIASPVPGSRGPLLRAQAIADARFGQKVLGPGGVVLELLAKLVHEEPQVL